MSRLIDVTPTLRVELHDDTGRVSWSSLAVLEREHVVARIEQEIAELEARTAARVAVLRETAREVAARPVVARRVVWVAGSVLGRFT